jgi:hypothetical protein
MTSTKTHQMTSRTIIFLTAALSACGGAGDVSLQPAQPAPYRISTQTAVTISNQTETDIEYNCCQIKVGADGKEPVVYPIGTVCPLLPSKLRASQSASCDVTLPPSAGRYFLTLQVSRAGGWMKTVTSPSFSVE